MPASLAWQRRWLIGLGALLVAVAVGLSLAGSRRAWFIVVAVPIAWVPFAWARLRLFRHLAGWRAAGWGAALCDLTMVAQLLTARSSDAVPLLHAPGLEWVGPVWFSAHALAALLYGGRGLLRLVLRPLAGWWARPRPAAAAEDETGGLGRREFLQQFSVVGAAAPFAVSLSGVPLSYDFRVEEREITLPGWPRALDGLRVAHLSDIHVGGAMDRARLLEVAALTAAARPDLVLHTGDFLTHRSGDFDAPLYEALARLTPRYGQWACLGNHDFDDPDRLVAKLRAAGVTVLRDELVVLDLDGQPLELGGLDFAFDRANRAAIAARKLARWPARGAAPRLLLDHDPSHFAVLPDGCADLVLSGHTHGGHVGVQLGRDAALTVVGLAGYPDQGVFTRGDMHLFVTRCVGFYGYPMRVGIPPEIALLTLRAPASV